VFLINVRKLKYPILIVAAIAGLVLGDWVGPIPKGLFDWGAFLDPQLRQYIYAHHYMVMGVFACVLSYAASRFVDAGSISVISVSLIALLISVSVDFARNGALGYVVFLHFADVARPYLVGVFAALGAASLASHIWTRSVQSGNT